MTTPPLSRKAQASLEYAATYLYAGIALLITVAVIGYMGGFDSTTYKSESCESGAQIRCIDASLTDEGVASFLFQNALDRSILLRRIIIIAPDKTNTSYELAVSVDPGKNVTFTTQLDNEFRSRKEELSYELIYRPEGSQQDYLIRGSAINKVERKIQPTGEPGAVTPGCGNGIIETFLGEECEHSSLRQTCGGLNLVSTQSTLQSTVVPCDLATCKLIRAVCTPYACEAAGQHWLGDQLTGRCCGIAAGEYYLTTKTSGITSYASSSACCASPDACVFGGVCYERGALIQVDSANTDPEICVASYADSSSSVWMDCDQNQPSACGNGQVCESGRCVTVAVCNNDKTCAGAETIANCGDCNEIHFLSGLPGWRIDNTGRDGTPSMYPLATISSGTNGIRFSTYNDLFSSNRDALASQTVRLPLASTSRIYATVYLTSLTENDPSGHAVIEISFYNAQGVLVGTSSQSLDALVTASGLQDGWNTNSWQMTPPAGATSFSITRLGIESTPVGNPYDIVIAGIRFYQSETY